MSRSPEELLKLASDYDNVATRALVVTAKKKEKKKLDPKAKVRNRGTVCVSAEQAKDKKDHFPINDEAQARNALARVQQLSSAPWYKGSLEGLKALVSRKVKAKYPGINVGGKDSKKKSSEYYDALLNKFAQQVSYGVGLSSDDQAKLLGLVRSLAAKNAGLSTELNSAFSTLSAHRTEENGSSYFVPENVQTFLPVLDKVKVALNQTDPNGAELQTAIALYDLFKRMSVASAPAQAGGQRGAKYSKIDTTFQTMLGVNPDGSLGPMTQSALEQYKKSVGIPNGAGSEATLRTDSKKTNQQAFDHLKQRPEYQTKKRIAWDDNTNTYAGYDAKLGF